MERINGSQGRQSYRRGKIRSATRALRAATDPPDRRTLQAHRERIEAFVRSRSAAAGKRELAKSDESLGRRLVAIDELLAARRPKRGPYDPSDIWKHVRSALDARGADSVDSARRKGVLEPKPMRFILESNEPTDARALLEQIRLALGYDSTQQAIEAGVLVESLFVKYRTRECFTITVAASETELRVSPAQVAATLAHSLPAKRLSAVPTDDPRRFLRTIERCGAWRKPDGTTEAGCCCCCCCTSSDHGRPRPSETRRPVWESTPDDTEWHLKQMRIKEAWALDLPSGGKSQGEGVVIAHPDTGWREHVEYDEAAIAFDRARNVLNGTDGKDATRHGTITAPPVKFETHGTATGGVMVSAVASGNTFVQDIPGNKWTATTSNVQLSGVAPKASVVPIRCTDTVILIMDTNIHRAIEHAIDIGAHVVSISLGGILDSTLEEIITRAVHEKHMIVVAAAGQGADFLSPNKSVVEPASFEDAIAVAGSTPAGIPWTGSSRGAAVDITAPAQGIWFPNFFLEGSPGIYWGEGTSFAAAEVASVAALWLAHWGRGTLLSKYGDVPLAHVFRQLIRATAWKPDNWDPRWGPGIIDAHALLSAPLPEKDTVLAPGKAQNSTFVVLSDLLEGSGRMAAWAWEGIVGGAGEIGDLFGELVNLQAMMDDLAELRSLAENAPADLRGWADEQMAELQGAIEEEINAVGSLVGEIVEAGEDAVEALAELVDAAGDVFDEVGEGAADLWNQTTGLLSGFLPSP